MRVITFLSAVCIITSCLNKTNSEQSHFYYFNSCKRDTTFFDQPSFDTAGLTVIATKEFLDHPGFQGYVVKLANDPAPIDGRIIYFVTPEYGIIFSKSATWSCYRRLHSTNDTIEARISTYIDNILSNGKLLSAGEDKSIY